MLIADVTTGISSTAAQQLPLTVRPAPMEEEALIDVPGAPRNAELHLMITDMLGRAVRDEAINALPHVLQRGSLVSGLYTCRVLAGSRVIAIAEIAVR